MQNDDVRFLQERFSHAEDEYFQKNLELQKDGLRHLYVLREGGALLGYVILNFAPRYSLYRKLSIPEIQDLFVAQECRGKGAGRFLLSHCENAAKKKAATAIGVSVGLHKAFGPAQRLYFQSGYSPDGYGVTYDRQPVNAGDRVALDDDLCLMMVKDL
jgi:GNAT superfamily N-acetyltransferase